MRRRMNNIHYRMIEYRVWIVIIHQWVCEALNLVYSCEMSRQRCSQYIAEVEKLIQYGGSRNEQTLRPAFQKLLSDYCEAKHLMLLAELGYTTVKGKQVRPDGTVR